MNCKKGELAYYVGSDKSQWMKVVRCIELHPLGRQMVGEACWVVQPPLLMHDGSNEHADAVFDSALRPINNPPGADETLTWKEVPKPSIMSPKPQKEHT